MHSEFHRILVTVTMVGVQFIFRNTVCTVLARIAFTWRLNDILNISKGNMTPLKQTNKQIFLEAFASFWSIPRDLLL